MKQGKMIPLFAFMMLLATLFLGSATADTIPAPIIVASNQGYVGYKVQVTVYIDNPENHFLLYDVQYGDGTWDKGSIWDGSEVLEFSHVWSNPGQYEITAQIANVDTGEISEIAVHYISIAVGIPAPIIKGKPQGFVDQEIEVRLIVDNSLGHYLLYDIQFGDGEFERGGILEQGIVELTFVHVWQFSGSYDITAQIGDVDIGMVSETTVKPILIKGYLSDTWL